MHLRIGFVALAGVILCCSRAWSSVERIEFLAGEPVVVTSAETGAVQILLTFPDLHDYAGRTIKDAQLILPDWSVSEDVRLDAYAVAVAWDAGTVVWGDLQEPGSGFNPRTHASCRISPERDLDQPIWMPVTSYLYGVCDLEQPDRGLLLRCPGYLGDGIAASLVPTLPDFSSARIIATFVVEREGE